MPPRKPPAEISVYQLISRMKKRAAREPPTPFQRDVVASMDKMVASLDQFAVLYQAVNRRLHRLETMVVTDDMIDEG